jgi:biotin carboxyl carrier protein
MRITNLAAVLMATATLMVACGGGGGSTTPTAPTPTASAPAPTTPAPTTPTAPAPTTPTPNTTAPVLSVPFVAPESAVAFFIFGATLPSGVQNPTYEIETANQSTAVFASSPGRVVNITTTSQGDRAVFIVPSDNSVFDIAYDHVNNVQVSIGQSVTAGQQIGTVGTLNNGRGRTELQINRSDATPVLAQCPRNFGTTAFNDAFQAAALRLNGSATVCNADTVRP